MSTGPQDPSLANWWPPTRLGLSCPQGCIERLLPLQPTDPSAQFALRDPAEKNAAFGSWRVSGEMV
jgi:hypothetical protein